MSSSEWTFCVCLLTCLLNWSVSEVKTVQSGVQWIRPDLLSKGSGFFFRDDHTYEDYLVPSFHGRVELRDPQMDGDISVILKKINVKDRGRYKCVSVRKRSRNKRALPDMNKTTEMVVEGSGDGAGHSGDGGIQDGGYIDRVKSVSPGEDVLLLCQGPRGADIIFLQWIRPDLESEGSVFFFRDDRTYKNYQHPSFHGRVELRDPQMKDGDVSVILKDVNIKDTGTYECYVRVKGNSPQLISSVHLKFKDPDQQITVKTGDDVTLQCRGPRGGDIKLLMWRKQDLEEDVFICSHGSMPEDLQHPSFKNRVELRDPQMKDGDVSVILKKVNIKDTGTYECYVRNSSTSTQFISSINLTVVNSGGGAGHTEDGGDRVGLIFGLSVVIVLVFFLVVVGFTIYRKSKRLKKLIYQLPADEAAEPELQDLTAEPEEKLKEEEPPVET